MDAASISREKSTEKELACAHCSEVVPAQQMRFWEEKPFCCDGCLQVHQLLSNHGLNDYYRLPGRSSIKPLRQKSWEWLDTPEVGQQLFSFNDGKRARLRLVLPGIHCASCIWLLEKLPKLEPGILRADADVTTGSIDFLIDPAAISLSKLASTLDVLGYPPEIPRKDAPKVNRKWMIKLAVAGFSFGNVMLFSFPEYLGLHSEEDFFPLVFGGLNLAFSFPAFFYAGWGYMQSAYTALKHKTINVDVPLALGMVALFGVTVYDIVSGTGPGYADSLTGLIFFLLIGKWYQEELFRKFRFERDYQSHLPLAACKIVDGQTLYLPVQQLEKGDRVRVKRGEVIPADGRVVEGEGLLDYHMITGESAPVPVQSQDRIFAGGENTGHTFDMVCTAKPNQSYLAGLWKEAPFQGKIERPFVRRIDRIAAWFIGIILLISAISFLYWLPQGTGVAFRVLASILIITCPCALALSVPFIFGNTARLLANRGWFLRNPDKLEVLAKITDLALDKTGTLTSSSGQTAEFKGEPLNPRQTMAASWMAGASTHPLSQAIAKFLPKAPDFESKNLQHLPGKGLEWQHEGFRYRLGSGRWLFQEDEPLPQAGGSLVYFAENEKVLGYFYLANTFRPGLEKMFRLLAPDFGLHVLSGDHEGERETLDKLTHQKAALHFHYGPDEKGHYITTLQNQGKKVLFAGDGLNDTGALALADLGLAVNDSGSGLLPPCDGMVKGNALPTLPVLLFMGKRAVRLTHFSLAISLSYNVIGLAFAVSGNLHPIVAAILMPASSLSVVGFALATTWWSMKKLDRIWSKTT